jgi:YVTN family beta-propeller protein
VAISSDGRRVLATAQFSGELFVYALENDQLMPRGSLPLGFEPRGVVISPDNKTAYVALSTAAAIAVVDLEKLELLDRISTGRWPRSLALSADGSRLAVACNGDGGIAVIDAAARKQLYLEDFSGLNFGQMQVSADGKHVYFPWMVYRQNPITAENIRRGWVLASRIARVRLDGKARREAIALDPRGQAVGDPNGLALSPDAQTLVCAASGTHELLVYELPGLPFQDYGGPGDHIDAELLKDQKRFDRIPLGGRPMAVRYSSRGDKVYIANYLLNAVQVVDVANRKLIQTIPLSETPATSLARQGETVFYDAGRSLDQWYSCHSCHYEGHTNAVSMDTRNDGRFGNFKTVPTLRGAAATGPWFWHGWATDFRAALKKSMTDTMLGKEPSETDVDALAAFVEKLDFPSPKRPTSQSANEAVKRGEAVFLSAKAGCAQCHPLPKFTDAAMHNVGLGAKDDVYPEYNTPSLRGLSTRVRFLHDGRAQTIEEVLTGPHKPSQVGGTGELSQAELSDLLAYLESI